MKHDNTSLRDILGVFALVIVALVLAFVPLPGEGQGVQYQGNVVNRGGDTMQGPLLNQYSLEYASIASLTTEAASITTRLNTDVASLTTEAASITTRLNTDVGSLTDDLVLHLRLDGTRPMTGNLRMGGYWLSNDGGNEGVFVAADGNVGIGTTTPQVQFHVDKSTACEMAITCSDGSPTGIYLYSATTLPYLLYQGGALNIGNVTGTGGTGYAETMIVGRGTGDTDITYITLFNANGTRCDHYPNAEGNGIIVTTSAP